MLTGRQIREARRLLRWGKVQFSRTASVPLDLIKAVESSDGAAWLSRVQETAIRRAFEQAGVEFTDGAGGGVRLKAGPCA